MACTAGYAAAQDVALAPPQIRLAPQQTPSATGSVTGHVYCSDTQRPARFAQVMLISADEADDSRNRGFFGGRGGARTDLDGSFTATNLAPGDYYVSASATGYISEASLLVASGMDMASALSKLPTVHVSANATSNVNVSLDRGGVIAGRIQWDDGSAAAGVQVGVIDANPQPASGRAGGLAMFGGLGGFGGDSGQSDDRGQFRLTGLAPGDYLVRALIQTPVPSGQDGGSGRTSMVMMYAPGKVRRADAQTITVHAGEERTDLVMVMDLASLHRVSGHVSAASGTVGSGTVRLADTQDTSLARTSAIGPDGSYSLSYVPAGTYTLSVPFASTATTQDSRVGPQGGGRSRGGRAGSSFQPFQETLSVTNGDLTGVDVTLVPAQAASTP